MLVLRLAPLVLFAAVVQVSSIAGGRIFGAEPDLLLVTIVAIGLLRGSVVGASAGFAAGLLVDVMTLGTLGVTSLLLLGVGYWSGRYGETTGQGRAYAPSLTAFVMTFALAAVGAALHYLLGESVAAAEVLRTILPSALVAAVLVLPVTRVCRAVLGAPIQTMRAREVEFV
jgi:rod shape-determining protein MreD